MAPSRIHNNQQGVFIEIVAASSDTCVHLLPVALLVFLAAPARARIIPPHLLVWLIAALNSRRLLFHEVNTFNRGYPECKVGLAVLISNSKVTPVNYIHPYKDFSVPADRPFANTDLRNYYFIG